MGSKNSFGDPITFLKDSPNPVVYVAINYRLGHFGFLGGPTLTLAAGTVPNAGLHDQRFGLQWVQDNIHLFGGNKDEVTMMAVSAGAGSALHHITAYGGQDKPAMFKRVVAMNAGFVPRGGHSDVQGEFEEFEAAVGCMFSFLLPPLPSARVQFDILSRRCWQRRRLYSGSPNGDLDKGQQGHHHSTQSAPFWPFP